MPYLLWELPFITSDVSTNFNHNLLTLTVLLIVMPNLHHTIAAITCFFFDLWNIPFKLRQAIKNSSLRMLWFRLWKFKRHVLSTSLAHHALSIPQDRKFSKKRLHLFGDTPNLNWLRRAPWTYLEWNRHHLWVFKEMIGFRITDSWLILLIRNNKTQESIVVIHVACH